jgi:hypothetical protein
MERGLKMRRSYKYLTCYSYFDFWYIEAIRDVNEDVLSLRYYSEHKAVNSISFQEALGSIEATKQMLLAAGCSIVNPVLYHKRLGRTEALEFLKKTRFRHTQESSFILKVSCPIQLEAPLLSETLLNDSPYNLKFQDVSSQETEEKLFTEILDQAVINIQKNPEFSKIASLATS